jgi:hypothetical protein
MRDAQASDASIVPSHYGGYWAGWCYSTTVEGRTATPNSLRRCQMEKGRRKSRPLGLNVVVRYCFSYTAVLLTLLPFASVPLVVTVRLLPSADTVIRPVIVTLPPFLMVIDSV